MSQRFTRFSTLVGFASCGTLLAIFGSCVFLLPTIFREVKQNWHFEHPPKKTKEGVCVHAYMVMAMKALTTAFLKWQEKQLKLEALGKQTTWQMYRRKLKVLNRNKLIVFVGSHFGIFPSHEVFILADVPVRKTAIELDINRTQIYTKYTGMLPTDN